MAQQKGIIPLQGTLGNITFFKSKDGYMAREKGSLDASRIANDPAFQRTRENGAEFGRAGKAGKILRTALRAQLQNTADSRMISRLTRDLMKVVQSDTVNDRGMRNVQEGNVQLLEGFEFNLNSKLSTTLFAPYTLTINRVAGTLAVNIPAFIPMNLVAAPAGSTHFKITTAGLAVDFNGNQYEVDTTDSGILPWSTAPTAPLALENSVAPNSSQPLFLVVGIEFYQEVNGTHYALKNGAFNAISLVKVEA